MAILYLDRIENQVKYSDQSIPLYNRYIDDCITPASSHKKGFQDSKHSILPRSHHREQIKRATIVNTITTYEAICSNDTLLKEAEVLFEDSDANGYKREYVKTILYHLYQRALQMTSEKL